MNQLLIFLVFLIAVVIYTIALEKLLSSPILVSAIIFATFLIISLITMDYVFLIFTFVFTIVSYFTAYIVCLLQRIRPTTIIQNDANNEIITSDNNINNTYNCMNYMCRKTCNYRKNY